MAWFSPDDCSRFCRIKAPTDVNNLGRIVMKVFGRQSKTMIVDHSVRHVNMSTGVQRARDNILNGSMTELSVYVF